MKYIWLDLHACIYCTCQVWWWKGGRLGVVRGCSGENNGQSWGSPVMTHWIFFGQPHKNTNKIQVGSPQTRHPLNDSQIWTKAYLHHEYESQWWFGSEINYKILTNRRRWRNPKKRRLLRRLTGKHFPGCFLSHPNVLVLAGCLDRWNRRTGETRTPLFVHLAKHRRWVLFKASEKTDGPVCNHLWLHWGY